ncbi:MAG: hypothetical protein OEV42_08305 [Deltaproteobacteria bacterium]|nr:hypothetical protein [Deltaproteobacteria bacterium]
MTDTAKIMDESIKLELNISKLYTLFLRIFPEHRDFWWTLSIEEKNHASLLLAGKHHFARFSMMPENMLAAKLEKLEMINDELELLIYKLARIPPSEEDAFDLAIGIEESAGEVHFQNFMQKRSDKPLEKIFHKLNSGDEDHADRIRRYKAKYVMSGNISIGSSSIESAV